MQYTFYQLLFFFYIYSFLGWCVEVCYRSVKERKFINSGFLNGTYCPIYGFGMLAIILALTPVKDNLPVLFIGSVVFTTLLELITGFVLHKLFHTRWWDYSDIKFNIGGYICPIFSIMWGLGACIVMKGVHPAINIMVSSINTTFGAVLLLLMTALFAVDTFVTVATIRNLNRDLWILDDLARQMREQSNKIAEHLGNTAIEADELQQELRLDLEARFDMAKADIIDVRINSYYRIFKAFPNMKHDDFDDFLHELQEKLYE